MSAFPRLAVIATLALLSAAPPAQAQNSTLPGWIAGDWSLTLGASGYVAPRFQGANSLAFNAVPMISLGRSGKGAPFSSRNDNISVAFFDNGFFRAGPVGKILFERSDNDRDLRGLGTVRWGGVVGGFFDLYPSDWLRFRTEIRQGIRAHSGVVADLSADAFRDIAPGLQLSGGPRLSLASSSYYRAYFGVNPAQSAASGLQIYRPGSGVRALGFGGALTWKATDKVTTSLFAEYSRLLGPAADSSLVRQRGSVNQFTIGASATYRFDFSL
jgi:outer membrane protein